MTKPILLAAACATALSSSAIAGAIVYSTNKNPVPPAPAPVYGTGFYLGLDAGINAYTDFKDKDFSVGGNDVSISANDKVGFVGGIKAGYVFGTGTVRPAIEADLYYNGVQGDLDVTVNGKKTSANAQADLNSGAFMANFLVRFAFDRFQPYVGGGIGGYYAQADDVEITTGGTKVKGPNGTTLTTKKRTFHGGGASNSGFAWQIVAGADYYFTEKFSTFLEYKFLNYEDAGFSGDRLGQQIVVLGLRWHF
jgi:opacity protein-like surface antigen